MIKADLHTHSTASDGTLEPEQLVARAAQRGFTHLALTDHESVEGIARAQEEAVRWGIVLIPGVEISCNAGREVHILGYGLDPYDEALLAFFRERTLEREERAARMVANLEKDGEKISLARVRELAHGVMGRPHVARALVEEGYASSVSDAFDRYLVPGRCGYVPRKEIKVARAVQLLSQAGGVAVLAHPMELRLGDMALEALVREWKTQGLAGMEVYHPSAAANHAARLLSMARRENLLITGGSDFHGEEVRNVCIGQGLDRWQSMQEDVRTLLRRIGD